MKNKSKLINLALIVALVVLLFYGFILDIPSSIQAKLRDFGIITKPLGRQIRLYQINNPQDCRIQHILTQWFNAGIATFPNSKEHQKFYLGVKNLRKDALNIKNPQIMLTFYNIENIKVDLSKSRPWEPADPEGSYFIRDIKDEVQSSKSVISSLPVLFIRFEEDSICRVKYEIKSDTLPPEVGEFNIHVGKLCSEEKIGKPEPSQHLRVTPARSYNS